MLLLWKFFAFPGKFLRDFDRDGLRAAGESDIIKC